jgi:2-polyprenyl-3-methyl-5-hydroxy-6-metoxy-1,4-benzoquinol methylase
MQGFKISPHGEARDTLVVNFIVSLLASPWLYSGAVIGGKSMSTSYEEQLQHEAEVWGSEAERMAQQIPPDWTYHRHLLHNRLLHAAHIEALLANIHPNAVALELGCASGWLTLAMAQRGAQATGLDISEKSLTIARTYAESIADTLTGSVTYRVADLNTITLPANTYDVIATQGTLHHLLNVPQVIAQIYQALKPGGVLWINDNVMDVTPRAALMAAALMFLLPTHVSYRQKLAGLWRFGAKATSRIQASMEASGLSPFEGAGREHDWLTLVKRHFQIEQIYPSSDVTGYLAHQINLPVMMSMPILQGIRGFERLLITTGLLIPSGQVVYARK